MYTPFVSISLMLPSWSSEQYLIWFSGHTHTYTLNIEVDIIRWICRRQMFHNNNWKSNQTERIKLTSYNKCRHIRIYIQANIGDPEHIHEHWMIEQKSILIVSIWSVNESILSFRSSHDPLSLSFVLQSKPIVVGIYYAAL